MRGGPGPGGPASDSGPGVSKEEQERAFVRFYRSAMPPATGRGRRRAGAGDACAIIEAHGGSIALTGAAERGATVMIRLPADHDQAASASGS
ncbi:MAG: ATP-binding protein [Dehalococcoidia bacterium]